MDQGFVQVEFLIPVVRDSNLSDGRKQPTTAWHWLDDQLWEQFGGRTIAPGHYQGFYRDPDTGERINDKSRKYIVALPFTDLDLLRHLLKEASSRSAFISAWLGMLNLFLSSVSH